VASDRSEVAAARAAAAARRAEQLRDRIARLRAGEASTPDDVALAKISAANQRAEAVKAQDSLLRAYASSSALREEWRNAGLTGAATALGTGRRGQAEGSATPRETEILRHALVSIASSGEVKGGWSKERRQELWQALAEQCGRESWQGWLRALCHTAVSVLPGLRGVAISGYEAHGAPHLLAVTDEWTRQVEEIAQLVGEGPGVEAHRAQLPVLVTNLLDEQARWPGYVATAAGIGLSTVYSLPVMLDGVGLGSLTLYPSDQGGGGWHGWTDGFFLAAVAAKALLADLDAVEDGWPLGDVSDDRVQIATGMLAVRLDVSVEEASARLRAFAFSNARGLSEVAQSVLDGSVRMT
jgi:hypothetical protein